MKFSKEKQALISHEYVLAALKYDPVTGEFTWKADGTGGVKKGDKAGRLSKSNRRQIKIKSKLYYSNRLAWFYMTGEWPEEVVDHINRDTTDDRFLNLRVLSVSNNTRNSKYCLSDLFGVSRRKDRKSEWRVYIQPEPFKSPKFFGSRKTMEEAIALSWEVRSRLGLWDHVPGVVEELVRRGLREAL